MRGERGAGDPAATLSPGSRLLPTQGLNEEGLAAVSMSHLLPCSAAPSPLVQPSLPPARSMVIGDISPRPGAAGYITIRQEGLRCALRLREPPRCFGLAFAASRSTRTTFQCFRAACSGAGGSNKLTVNPSWCFKLDSVTANTHCWILNRSFYLL